MDLAFHPRVYDVLHSEVNRRAHQKTKLTHLLSIVRSLSRSTPTQTRPPSRSRECSAALLSANSDSNPRLALICSVSASQLSLPVCPSPVGSPLKPVRARVEAPLPWPMSLLREKRQADECRRGSVS